MPIVSSRSSTLRLLSSFLFSSGALLACGVSNDPLDSASGDGGAASTGGVTSADGGAAAGGTASGGTASTDTGGAGGTASSSGGADGVGGTPIGTGGATVEFNPCPPLPEACKILPSGDSITVGAQSTNTGGYRVPLFRRALESARHLTFVGPSGAGPETVAGVTFPENHDGHSGYVIDTIGTRKGLLPLVEQNLTKFTPHIVLLLIGTNDLNSKLEVASAPTRLAAVIDTFTTHAPDALIVVAQLTPTRTDALNQDVRTYNAALSEIVTTRIDAGKHLLLVDMYTAFTENPDYKTELLFDGLHPNDDGYAVMADVWFEAIAPYLR